MKLIGDRILVEPIKETVSVSGLIIPHKANKEFKARVIMTGVNVKKINVGNTVVYHEFSGEPWPLDDRYILLKESRDIKGYY